MALITLQYYNM